MNRILKFFGWSLCVALLIGLFFASNIRGYYRFKEICEKEAGLRVYKPLERDVGWTVKGGEFYETGFMVEFTEVAFVRYRNGTDGNVYDVYRTPKVKIGDPGYAQRPADLSKPVVYEYKSIQKSLEGEVRMGAWVRQFVDLRNSKIAATYSVISYGKFNPDNTILAAPSGEACPDDVIRTDPKTGRYFPMKIQLAISSMFIQ